MYAVGGYDGNSRQCLQTVEVYDPEGNSWKFVAEMSARRSGAAVGILNGFLYAVGGHDGPIVRQSVERFAFTQFLIILSKMMFTHGTLLITSNVADIFIRLNGIE